MANELDRKAVAIEYLINVRGSLLEIQNDCQDTLNRKEVVSVLAFSKKKSQRMNLFVVAYMTY